MFFFFARALSTLATDDGILPKWMPTMFQNLTHIVIHDAARIHVVDIRQKENIVWSV